MIKYKVQKVQRENYFLWFWYFFKLLVPFGTFCTKEMHKSFVLFYPLFGDKIYSFVFWYFLHFLVSFYKLSLLFCIIGTFYNILRFWYFYAFWHFLYFLQIFWFWYFFALFIPFEIFSIFFINFYSFFALLVLFEIVYVFGTFFALYE